MNVFCMTITPAREEKGEADKDRLEIRKRMEVVEKQTSRLWGLEVGSLDIYDLHKKAGY